MPSHKKSDAEHRGDAQKQLDSLGRVSVPNAAVLLGMHPYTLRNYISLGYVETLVIGKRPWIMRDEIVRYLAHGKRSPEPQSEIPDLY
jgi:hypothetical protein